MGFCRDLLGTGEITMGLFYRQLAAEALGSAILVIFGCGAAMAVSPVDALQPTTISIAVTFGLTLATVIWIVGGVSGAHFNPSVSVAMLFTGKMPLVRCLGYILAQCGGAIAGAALLWVLTPEHRRGMLGATLLAEEVTVWQGLVVEILATFTLVITIFASSDQLRGDHRGSTALSVGFVLTLDIPWAIQYTGASMNPARSLGPCVMTGLWEHHWVFWLGPIIGALAAGLIYEFVFDQRHIRSEAVHGDVTYSHDVTMEAEVETPSSGQNGDVDHSIVYANAAYENDGDLECGQRERGHADGQDASGPLPGVHPRPVWQGHRRCYPLVGSHTETLTWLGYTK